MLSPCLCRRLSTFSALSTVHQGTAYEEWSMRVLQKRLSMTLHRVGGKSDGGIDLQGWWWLPSNDEERKTKQFGRRLRVLAQCKSEKKKIGPKYVREMEGVLHQFASAPTLHTSPGEHATEAYPTVGLFISASPFSKMTLLRAQSSSLPLALLCLPYPTPEQLETAQEDAQSHEQIGSIVFNTALGGTSGLLGGDLIPRWEYPTGKNASVVGRPALWWNGRRMGSCVPSEAREES